MKFKPVFLAPLWAGSLALAFVFGKTNSSSSNTETASQRSSKSSSSRNNNGSTSTGQESGSSSAQARLKAAPMIKAGSSVEQMIKDIATYNDPVERSAALLNLVDTLSPEEFESVVAEFRGIGITNQRRGEYQILLTAWAKVDPTSAMAYADENTNGQFARNTILTAWASKSPASAIAWAEEKHGEAEGANPWLVGIIQGVAPNNPARATEIMGSMPRSRERGSALNVLVSQVISDGPDAAKEWAGSVEEEGLRSSAYAYTAEALARSNPADAAEWLANTGDVNALNRAGEEIASDWYRENPEEATAWVNSLPSEAMSGAAEGIVDRVVREDPVQAAEYLSELASSNPNTNFDSSIRQLVRGSVQSDPELAAVWVSGLSDTRTQEQYYDRILRNWRNRDSSAANDWILENQSTLPDRIQRRFLNEQTRQN